MDFHASSQGQGYSNHHATTAFNAETSTARFIRLQSDTEPIFHDHDQDESHHHLPNDLLLEVLYRLPVKSIFRLRCVSKRWLHMLSDPSFFRCYNISRFGDDWLPWRLYFQFVHGMIFQDSSSHYNLPIRYVTSKHSAFKSSGFPLPFTSSSQQKQQPPPPPLKYYEVLSSSNDLLLLYGRPKYSREQNLYYVSNPFTKQLIALPPPPPPHPYHDGLISFGFISQVKNGVTHYKVVQFKDVREPHQPLPAHRGNLIMDLDTFSFETGEWMNSEVPLPLFSKKECHLYPAIPYNGILHWLDPRHGVIIAYDPENSTDECRLIQTPALMDNHLSGLNVVLNVCQGRLRYFETADICTGPCMVLPWRGWVLKDYHRGEWCLERSCMRREICSFDAHPDIHKRCRALMPLAFHPFNWDIMYFWCQDYILSFNLRTGWFEHEYYPIPAIGLICWWVVFQSMPPPWTKKFPPQWWDPCFDEEMITQRKGNKGILEKILEFPLRILGKGNRN